MIVISECWGPKRVLNSKCKVEVILDHIRDHREGIAQNKEGINKIPRNVESQFNGKERTLEVGSKTENKLVITFSLVPSYKVWKKYWSSSEEF